MYHDVSMRILFLRYISSSLVVVYSSRGFVVPKFKHRQIKAYITTILMHDDAICTFSWMQQYATLRSVFSESGYILKAI